MISASVMGASMRCPRKPQSASLERKASPMNSRTACRNNPGDRGSGVDISNVPSDCVHNHGGPQILLGCIPDSGADGSLLASCGDSRRLHRMITETGGAQPNYF